MCSASWPANQYRTRWPSRAAKSYTKGSTAICCIVSKNISVKQSSKCPPAALITHADYDSSSSKLPFDEDDAGMIFDDLSRGRSSIPPHNVPVRPALVRWDLSQPLSLENVVVMEYAEADRHMKECAGETGKRPEAVWGAEMAAVVGHRASEVKRIRDWTMYN